MNRTLSTRLDKLEAARPPMSAVIVEVRWDERRDDAIKAALPHGRPGGSPVYTHTAPMSTDEWLQFVQSRHEGKTQYGIHGGSGAFFPNMHTATRIRPADRPWRRQ